MSTESDFNEDDRAYCDALTQLAKALIALGAQAAHELIEEEAGAALLFDLQLAITEVNTEFHDELHKLAGGVTDRLGFKAEVFFGSAEQAAAGKRALEAASFAVGPLPRPAEAKQPTAGVMAYGVCPCDADTSEIVLNLETLLKPSGGTVWKLGPIVESKSAPRRYEMAKHHLEQPGRSDG